MSMVWDEVKCIPSSDTNVFKYVFTKKDAVAEAVLYRYGSFEERTVICCSTQSGCPIGCRFCGAGDHFIRSLTAEEIVSQTMIMIKDHNIDTSKVKKMQIMAMSMGEPMLNYQELETSIKILYDLFPTCALLISTSGPKTKWYERLRNLSVEVPTVGLQFSVHESTDEARNKLIPFEGKMTLEEISIEGYLWHQATGRKPYFNYCAHDNNTSDEDVIRLKKLFDPSIWCATVSVICERDESIAAANARQEKLAVDFMNKLKLEDYDVRTFNPAGQTDTGSGCGQLWFVQSWMKENAEKIKNSIGYGLDKVHTPT